MTAQFIGGFHAHALAIPFDLVGANVVEQVGGQLELSDQIEFGDLRLDAADCRVAGIRRQLEDKGAR
jgi:hypothetical protein